MKTFIIPTIIVVCAVSLVHGLPGSYYSSTSNKWQDLTELSQQLRTLLEETGDGISSTAKNDNAVVGGRISETIYLYWPDIMRIVDQFDDKIKAHSLELEEADGMFQQLFQYLGESREKIKDDVKQLSESAQAKIYYILLACHHGGTELAKSMKSILSGDSVGTGTEVSNQGSVENFP